jgi:beta-glucosidase
MPHRWPEHLAGKLREPDPETGELVARLVARLTLDEKIQLVTGRDFWSTYPLEAIGLRSMVFSDGPSGVRGRSWDERDPSLNLPSATALSSSWDPDIARRYGAAVAVEARRKGVDVILGPTINLHRSPLGGRHFECFSEDPVLTSSLAAAYVSGVQGNGVGATLKHYVANDAETDRFTVDVRVDSRALRELYLLAFEKAVTEARAWLVMSAYNSVNGITVTESPLLETPLNSEWRFDGVVISDWTAVRTLESARASQDLVMPGPQGPWGQALADVIRAGAVDEGVVDRKVSRLLHLAVRVGALEGAKPIDPVLVEDGQAFARRVAVEGTVLMANRGELPWDAAELKSLAVIGDNAAHARTQGGGSATVIPAYTVSPLDGLRRALSGTRIEYARGASVQTGLSDLPLEQLTNPVTGGRGVHVRFRGADGTELLAEDRFTSVPLVWFGNEAPLIDAVRVEVTTRFTPEEDATLNLGFAMVGRGLVWVNETLLLDEALKAVGDDLGAAFLSPATATAPVTCSAGVPMDLRFEVRCDHAESLLPGAITFQFGIEAPLMDEDALIAEAVVAASSCDVAVVVVGTSSAVESEGYDRASLSLPGRQDDLVRAVAAANPHTVVVVNAGAPVLMPWRDDVAALLIGYFGGQEFGNALADILLGAAEPGGRLPTTWPKREEDLPVRSTSPVDGRLEYTESIHVGYRGWLKQELSGGASPAYPFGHGLGYTDIVPTALEAASPVRGGEQAAVTVRVANHGARPGKQVIQVYAQRQASVVDRPVRWLVAFTSVRLDAGQVTRIDLPVDTRLLAYWADGWTYEPGEYQLLVGTSAVDLPLRASIQVIAWTGPSHLRREKGASGAC